MSDITLHTLFDYMRKIDERAIELDKKLREHMAAEEEGMRGIRAELNTLSSVIQSMPYVDGQPDFHGHRVDHDEFRIRRAERRESTKATRTIVTEFLVRGVLTITVVLILGEKIAGMIK